MKLEELHQIHRRHLLSMRRSPRTVEFYEQGMLALTRYLDSQGTPPDTDHVSRLTLQELQLALRERGLSPGGEHAILRAIRGAFRWAIEEELITVDPTRKLRMPALPQERPPTVQPEEIRAALKLVAAMDQPLRNRALLLVMLDCGLRMGEIIQLRVEDVDLAAGMVTVRAETAKREKERRVPIGIKASRAVAAYERRERDPVFPHVGELFLNRSGEPMTAGGIHHLMVKVAKGIGVPRSHVAPHAWRRAFAVGMLRGGANLFELQQMMGHTTLEMTRKYVKLLPDDLQRVHLRASPADRL
ncbi:tyrosine-type recombinase/integrase [Deinococcus fonticola]|uniref:tyrosine-type recombinase/integrase n=1 Tax=Deinococcus fonticola TaxID=2528713 RepID=UPI00107503E7|nr:tyrosine-type recombinase/integrase [Deinococcus fonticola]